jgi:hypothetical protein
MPLRIVPNTAVGANPYRRSKHGIPIRSADCNADFNFGGGKGGCFGSERGANARKRLKS